MEPNENKLHNNINSRGYTVIILILANLKFLFILVKIGNWQNTGFLFFLEEIK